MAAKYAFKFALVTILIINYQAVFVCLTTYGMQYS